MKSKEQIAKIAERNRQYRERVKAEEARKRANVLQMSEEEQRKHIDNYLANNGIVKDHKPFPYGSSGLKCKGISEV